MKKNMIKNSMITALLSAALANAALAGERDVHKSGQFFQNVKAEHVVPLLDGSAYVSHEDYNQLGNMRAGGEVGIVWFGNGTRYFCGGYPSRNEPYYYYKNKYSGKIINNMHIRAEYPLIEIEIGEKIGHELLRYDADSGALTNYWIQKSRWWEVGTGHLQTGLPAVTWDLCPDFPSAKSLGAPVNEKQTAKFYNDLVAQDYGKRVRKPEYETSAETVEWADIKGRRRK